MCKVLCLPSTLHSFSLNVSLNFQIELRRLILSRPARPRRPGRGVTPAFWTPDLSPPQRSLCEERGYTASLATKESRVSTLLVYERPTNAPPSPVLSSRAWEARAVQGGSTPKAVFYLSRHRHPARAGPLRFPHWNVATGTAGPQVCTRPWSSFLQSLIAQNSLEIQRTLLVLSLSSICFISCYSLVNNSLS